MASQAFDLPPSLWFTRSANRREWDWSGEATDDPAFTDPLRPPGSDRRLQQVRLWRDTPPATAHILVIHVGMGVSDGFGSGDDLSTLFETQGSVTLTVGGVSITGLQRLSGDTDEQYRFDIGDGFSVAAFQALWDETSGTAGATRGTLIVRDFEPPAPPAAYGGRKISGMAYGGRKLTGGAFGGRKFTI